MVGGVGATIANWYCLRASNLKKDKIPMEELDGKYTEQQLSEMGEYSPYFRYASVVFLCCLLWLTTALSDTSFK